MSSLFYRYSMPCSGRASKRTSITTIQSILLPALFLPVQNAMQRSNRLSTPTPPLCPKTRHEVR